MLCYIMRFVRMIKHHSSRRPRTPATWALWERLGKYYRIIDAKTAGTTCAVRAVLSYDYSYDMNQGEYKLLWYCL